MSEANAEKPEFDAFEETPAVELRVDAAERLAQQEAMEKVQTETGIKETREKIKQSRQKKSNAAPEKFAIETFGDFADQKDKDGKIVLTAEQTTAIEEAIDKAKNDDRFTPPHLAIGGKTATEYGGSRARNFSTVTKIISLPGDKKGFLVHNYPSSWIHRELDAFGKWTAGAPMRKAKSAAWKKTFETKSNVPTIETGDSNTVLMPFIENVNANDAFAFNHEIDDFGTMPEVAEYDLNKKLDLSDQIVDELARIHGTGKAWGEAILANMIITREGKPIIVDPEIRYDDDVPLSEQKAYDLIDFIQSLTSALKRSEKKIDIETIVERVIDHYPDKTVIKEIPKIAKAKSKWYRKLLRPIHELPRLGQNGKDYETVVKILLER